MYYHGGCSDNRGFSGIAVLRGCQTRPCPMATANGDGHGNGEGDENGEYHGDFHGECHCECHGQSDENGECHVEGDKKSECHGYRVRWIDGDGDGNFRATARATLKFTTTEWSIETETTTERVGWR